MKMGFLGAGNMATAIINGMVVANVLPVSDILAYDVSADACGRIAQTGITVCDSIYNLFETSDMVLLAIKPQVLESALSPYADMLSGKAVISIAAGWTLDRLSRVLPSDCRVLQVMPNTPALVGCGMSALCKNNTFTHDESAFAEKLFGAIGEFCWLDERLFDGVTGVSGSGAAYVYMFIEAMSDGGVQCGLPRDVSMKLAAQTVLGAAEMVLKSGKHPGQLKDAVCSPAGTTIEAVRTLEKLGLRSAVTEAVITCAEKSRDMSK